MFHRVKVRWRWAALLSVLVLSSTALILSPSATAKWVADEPCVSEGKTLKQKYGYSVVVVTSDCTEIPVGERWAPSVPWITNSQFAQKPSGFETDWPTPVTDFRDKLRGVEYVVNPGTSYEYNRGFPNDNKIWTGQFPEMPGMPAVNTVGLGVLDPLPVGQHVVEVYWTLSGPHCDGFSADQATSCLPQGKTLVKRINFTVVDPYADPAAGD